MSPNLSVVQLEAGVDWLTLMCDGDEEKSRAFAVVERCWEEDAAQGEKPRPWRWQGYQGWLTPSIRAGSMGGRLCVQTSGSQANTLWTRLASSGGRPTRLDVQTTVQLSSSEDAFGMRFLRRARTTHRRPPNSCPKISVAKDTDGLWLGTVGRRTAPRFVRVYDKGVETKTAPPGILWRVELEAKQQLAEALWTGIRQAKDSARFCLEQCRAHLTSAGCSWPSIVESDRRAPVRGPKPPPPTAASLLAWYKSGVAPTIPKVLAVYGMKAVLDALGLPTLGMVDDADSE